VAINAVAIKAVAIKAVAIEAVAIKAVAIKCRGDKFKSSVGERRSLQAESIASQADNAPCLVHPTLVKSAWGPAFLRCESLRKPLQFRRRTG